MKGQSRAWEITIAVAAVMILLGVPAVGIYWWHQGSVHPVQHYRVDIGGWYNRHVTRWT